MESIRQAGRSDDSRSRRASIGPQRSPDAQAAILDAASAILEENGYEAFSIEAVARRAGAGKPTIYRWWPSKVALLLDVYDRVKGRLLAVPDTGDLEKDLVVFYRGLWRLWRGTVCGCAFRSMIAESQANVESLRALRERFVPMRDRVVVTLLSRAAQRGEIAAGVDLAAAADLIGGFSWYRLLTDQIDDDEAVASAMALMVRGLKRP